MLIKKMYLVQSFAEHYNDMAWVADVREDGIYYSNMLTSAKYFGKYGEAKEVAQRCNGDIKAYTIEIKDVL